MQMRQTSQPRTLRQRAAHGRKLAVMILDVRSPDGIKSKIMTANRTFTVAEARRVRVYGRAGRCNCLCRRLGRQAEGREESLGVEE